MKPFSSVDRLHDLNKARGTKRKFVFDSSMMETLAKEAEESALKQIEKDQAAALKHKLPDFWLPSLTPTYTSNGPPQSLLDVKLQTTCRGGNPPHPLSSVTDAFKSNAFADSSLLKLENSHARQIHAIFDVLKSFRGNHCSWGTEGKEGWAWTYMPIVQKENFEQYSHIPWESISSTWRGFSYVSSSCKTLCTRYL